MSSSSYVGGILNQHKKSGIDKPGRFILFERKDLCDDLAIEDTILNHSGTCPRELNFIHKSKIILGSNMPAMDCIVVPKWMLFGQGLVNHYEKFVEQFVNPQQDQHGVYSIQSKIECPSMMEKE